MPAPTASSAGRLRPGRAETAPRCPGGRRPHHGCDSRVGRQPGRALERPYRAQSRGPGEPHAAGAGTRRAGSRRRLVRGSARDRHHAGDPIEAHGIAEVYGSAARPLWIGSVKTNFGHLEAAAGVAGLLKTLLAVEHGQIPAHLHFRDLNPHIDFNGADIRVPAAPCPWPAGAGPRRAAVSSFGFSGTNAHVIVEQAPPRDTTEVVPGPFALPVSARSETALRKLALRYADYLRQASEMPLADFCRGAGARARFDKTAVLVAGSREETIAALERLSRGDVLSGGIANTSELPTAGRRVALPAYPFERRRIPREPARKGTWAGSPGQSVRIEAAGLDAVIWESEYSRANATLGGRPQSATKSGCPSRATSVRWSTAARESGRPAVLEDLAVEAPLV